MNDESRGIYSFDSQIKFKTWTIRSSLCDYNDVYVHDKRTITIPNMAATGAVTNNTNKEVIFKNCTSFSNCIGKINNTQVDDAHDIDVVISM